MRYVKRNEGFTMIELLVAMAIFSFMLLIIVVGFINIVRLHNQALAANLAQDNARTVMDEVVRAVRDSTGPAAPLGSTLCLNASDKSRQMYYLAPASNGVDKTLYRATTTDCVTPTSPHPVTSSSVNVSNFSSTLNSSGPKIVKPEIDLTVTVGTSSATTTGSGAGLKCGGTVQDRAFCSVVTLTSGAVPR